MGSSKQITHGPLMMAVVLWLFAGSEIFQRADVELNGTVVSSETSCMQPANNRCATVYVVESQDRSRHTYIAGPTDKALPRRLPVGTVIGKAKWALSYTVNGKEFRDFPVGFYSGILGLGLLLAAWWFTVTRHN